MEKLQLLTFQQKVSWRIYLERIPSHIRQVTVGPEDKLHQAQCLFAIRSSSHPGASGRQAPIRGILDGFPRFSMPRIGGQVNLQSRVCPSDETV